jgi:hypothetical protein
METIPYSWVQDQTDVVDVCACQGTVRVQAESSGDFQIIQTGGECILNQNCTCHEVYFDPTDYAQSDDGTLYVRVQECDGSWNLKQFTAPGTFNICIMNVWPYVGFNPYIMVGGNKTPPTSSTVTDYTTPCSGMIC